ncbi:MAG: hypothetical protein PF961_10615 [Planctomycetota bacterium]|jgi:hypothetical protein|nr:hypothetical protein [Planctomycetota bacterium]
MARMTENALEGNGKPIDKITSRYFELSADQHEAMTSDALDKKARDLATAASDGKRDYRKFPRWAMAEEKAIAGVAPDMTKEAQVSPYARLMSQSRGYEQAARSKEAISKGLLQEFANEDGTVERGIVSLDGSKKPAREGQWVKLNSEGQRLELSTFKDGKANGESLTYDPANGRVAEKGFYREGEKAGTFYSNFNEKGFAQHVEKFKGGALEKAYDRTPESVEMRKEERAQTQRAQEAVHAIRPSMG